MIAIDSDTRILCLDQPYATLWAMGVKRIETRAYPLPSTMPLPCYVIVHANVKRPKSDRIGPYFVDGRRTTAEPFLGQWKRSNVRHVVARRDHEADVLVRIPMPLGAIVGAVHVMDSVPMDRHARGPRIADLPHDGPLPHQQGGLWIVGPSRLTGGTPTRVEDQRPYGLYEPGRYGYLGDEFHALPEPIPHRGKQGWSDRATPELIAAVNQQIWGDRV